MSDVFTAFIMSANTYKSILEEKRELFINFIIDVFIAILGNRSDNLQNNLLTELQRQHYPDIALIQLNVKGK